MFQVITEQNSIFIDLIRYSSSFYKQNFHTYESVKEKVWKYKQVKHTKQKMFVQTGRPMTMASSSTKSRYKKK